MKILTYLVLLLVLVNCSNKTEPVFTALDVNPVRMLFDRKASKDEWVKLSSKHELHEQNEGIFYFEQGFSAFVVFDELNAPIRYVEY